MDADSNGGEWDYEGSEIVNIYIYISIQRTPI